MVFPVRTVSSPAALAGQTNGRLAASVLAETAGLAGGPGVLLVTPAARAWRALTAAASKDGHTLKISHPNSAYRPYADQERIFRERYVNWDTGNERRWWEGRWWWRRDGVAAAAVPGTSNHGWALAVDVGEERDGDSGAESIDSGTVAWLVANEERFGFSHEIQTEPWHIRYFTGDRIPQAVLDYEHGNPSQEDDDMPSIDEIKAAVDVVNNRVIGELQNALKNVTGIHDPSKNLLGEMQTSMKVVVGMIDPTADVDEAEVARQVAELIPDSIAEQVARNLAERLQA